tara:strand:- start:666 stop:1424 length:759 start_codon:yes stop_codon:yes gene_type:complete
MKKNPFHFEIKDLLIQFVAAFDDVVIGRYNRARELQDRIGVKYVYAPKQRVLHDLINKPQHITVPAIAVSINSISRDNDRVFNKIAGSYYQRRENLPDALLKTDYMPQPVPVDIGINMSVITKYQTDMDQILTNFIPYTDPYIVISWRNPDKNMTIGQEIRSPVEWSGSINMNYPTEINAGQPYRVTADTSFVIKGWMFKDEQREIPNILTVSVNAENVLHNQQVTNKGVVYEIDNEVLTPPKFTIDEDNDG